MKIAENSIVCAVDTAPSSSYTYTNYGERNEMRIEKKFTSGSAHMILFGNKIEAPAPELEDGETITCERFIQEFKKSGFYIALTSDE